MFKYWRFPAKNKNLSNLFHKQKVAAVKINATGTFNAWEMLNSTSDLILHTESCEHIECFWSLSDQKAPICHQCVEWMDFLSLVLLLHSDNPWRHGPISRMKEPERRGRTDGRLGGIWITFTKTQNGSVYRETRCWRWKPSRKQEMQIVLSTNICWMSSTCLCYSIALIFGSLFLPGGSWDAAVCLRSSFPWQER